MAVVSSLRVVNWFYLFLSLCKRIDKQVKYKNPHPVNRKRKTTGEGCFKVTKTRSFGRQPDKPAGVSSVLPVLDAQQRT